MAVLSKEIPSPCSFYFDAKVIIALSDYFPSDTASDIKKGCSKRLDKIYKKRKDQGKMEIIEGRSNQFHASFLKSYVKKEYIDHPGAASFIAYIYHLLKVQEFCYIAQSTGDKIVHKKLESIMVAFDKDLEKGSHSLDRSRTKFMYDTVLAAVKKLDKKVTVRVLRAFESHSKDISVWEYSKSIQSTKKNEKWVVKTGLLLASVAEVASVETSYKMTLAMEAQTQLWIAQSLEAIAASAYDKHLYINTQAASR